METELKARGVLPCRAQGRARRTTACRLLFENYEVPFTYRVWTRTFQKALRATRPFPESQLKERVLGRVRRRRVLRIPVSFSSSLSPPRLLTVRRLLRTEREGGVCGHRAQAGRTQVVSHL